MLHYAGPEPSEDVTDPVVRVTVGVRESELAKFRAAREELRETLVRASRNDRPLHVFDLMFCPLSHQDGIVLALRVLAESEKEDDPDA